MTDQMFSKAQLLALTFPLAMIPKPSDLNGFNEGVVEFVLEHEFLPDPPTISYLPDNGDGLVPFEVMDGRRRINSIYEAARRAREQGDGEKAERLLGMEINVMGYEHGQINPDVVTLASNHNRSHNFISDVNAVDNIRDSGVIDPKVIASMTGMDTMRVKMLVAFRDKLIPELYEAIFDGRLPETAAKVAKRFTIQDQIEILLPLLEESGKLTVQEVKDARQARKHTAVVDLPDDLFSDDSAPSSLRGEPDRVGQAFVSDLNNLIMQAMTAMEIHDPFIALGAIVANYCHYNETRVHIVMGNALIRCEQGDDPDSPETATFAGDEYSRHDYWDDPNNDEVEDELPFSDLPADEPQMIDRFAALNPKQQTALLAVYQSEVKGGQPFKAGWTDINGNKVHAMTLYHLQGEGLIYETDLRDWVLSPEGMTLAEQNQ